MNDQDPFILPGDHVLPNGNSSSTPIGQKPEESLELWPEDPSRIMSKAPPKFKKGDHNLRTRALFEKEGWLVFRVDATITSFSGAIFTRDFLGLFDWMAIKEGRQVIGIQVCHKNQIGVHVTKMTSSQETGFNKRRRVDNLNDWLRCGLRACLVGWEKVGARWEPTIRELGMPEVEAALARKRKAS
jgi:hypothetical protein